MLLNDCYTDGIMRHVSLLSLSIISLMSIQVILYISSGPFFFFFAEFHEMDVLLIYLLFNLLSKY